MAKYLEKFKKGISKIDNGVKKIKDKKNKNNQENHGFYGEDIDFEEDFEDNYDDYDRYDDMSIQPSQKPESFHHFILENQYKDLERSIRGFKDVFDKETQQWKTIRKKEHCFTDEEAEDILRTAQSHLATDIKLGRINKESFPILMDAIYQ